MQYGILDGILEQQQKKDVSGKTGEIQIKYGIQLIRMYQRQFISFGKCTMITSDVNIRENWVRGICELCIVLAVFL